MRTIYIPWVLYVLAIILACCGVQNGLPFWPEFLRMLVLLSGGVQSLWVAWLHLVEPTKVAKKIGWQPSGFQKEIAAVNIAIAIVAILSYIYITWVVPVAIILTVFYTICIAMHYREYIETRRIASATHRSLLIFSIVLTISLIAAIGLTMGTLHSHSYIINIR